MEVRGRAASRGTAAILSAWLFDLRKRRRALRDVVRQERARIAAPAPRGLRRRM
jgi:hypothetical protein